MNCIIIIFLFSSSSLVLFFQLVSCNAEESKSEAPIAIVFGGNGFAGSYIVESLLQNGYIVHTVHRGNDYWDYSTSNVAEYPEQAHPLKHHEQKLSSFSSIQYIYIYIYESDKMFHYFADNFLFVFYFLDIPTQLDSPTLSNSLYSTSSLFAGKASISFNYSDIPRNLIS